VQNGAAEQPHEPDGAARRRSGVSHRS
jgi:hypothetical protein